MKKYIVMATVAIMSANTVWAQYPPAFLTDENRPNGINWLPSPPSQKELSFAYDLYYYHWGHTQREGSTGELALSDESAKLNDVFSEALGVQIDSVSTPEILLLAERAVSDAQAANTKAKNYYQRKRPFAMFKEPSLKPWTDEMVAATYSYPSGHSIRGWIYALALTSLAPERADLLLARARQYAMNRVICGHHWKSDTDASVMLASGVYAAIVSTEEFQQQLAKARVEYERLKSEPTDVRRAKVVTLPVANGKAVNLQDTQATGNSGCVIIQKGQKVVSQ